MREPDGGPPRVRFAGYAAVFDALDHGGDIVERGAFQRSLSGRATIPLLWQHKAGAVIGRIDRIEEDGRGLRAHGRLEEGEQRRQEGDG